MEERREGRYEEAARCEILDYASGALRDPDRARVERHLVDCGECRAVLVAYARLVGPETPEEALVLDRVGELLDEREPLRPRPQPRSPSGLGSLALALAIAGTGVALRIWNGATRLDERC